MTSESLTQIEILQLSTFTKEIPNLAVLIIQ